ncbi:MAG: sugar fermentation stimulation protein [Thermoanaerobacteraceae bacterium]|nr:sugar fermentation stimulation protein [Thermoanaerobacteraceae bacterium]
MIIPGKKVHAIFEQRLNRFVAKVNFPDAPTERGTKHLLELIEAKREGFGAGVFFVIQREDAKFFSPNDAMDPAFGKALRAAARVGVDIFAYRCKVKPDSIELAETVKICLVCRNVSLH